MPRLERRPISLAWAARQRVVIALVLLILFGALRYDHFLGAYNVLERAALQFDVRADEPRHVLRHHDRRHRSLGRNDRGFRERRFGAAVAVRPLSRPARRPGRGTRRRRHQRLHGHADEHPAVHRHAVGHAGGERRRASAGAQPVGLGLLRHRFHLARAGRFARLSDPGLDRRRGLRLRLGRCSTTRASGATCWRSAATRRPRA